MRAKRDCETDGAPYEAPGANRYSPYSALLEALCRHASP